MSGRGKEGKGLGKGRAKRHRKGVLRDIQGITFPAIRLAMHLLLGILLDDFRKEAKVIVSGHGKEGKGLGKGRAKRHRKG